MFSNRMVMISPFLLLYLLGPLQYVTGYVANLPNIIAESAPISSFNTSNASPAIPIYEGASAVSQEEPPSELRVTYHWKAHGAAYGRFDFLDTVLLNIAATAVRSWNANMPAAKFPSSYHIAIGFVSNRSGPGLMAKHIIWALEEVFDIILENDRYSSGNVVIDLGSTTLGVGNVYAVLADSGPVNSSNTLTGDFARTSIGGSTLSSTWPPSTNTVLKRDSNSITIPDSILSQMSDASVHLGAHGDVKLQFWYRTHGAPVDDAQVYNASLKLLIQGAEAADKTSPIWPGVSTYNDMDDFTLTLRPNGILHRTDVTWLDTIIALSYIPHLMSKSSGPPGKFEELDGIIIIGTTTVGRFCIDKGDKSMVDLMDLCNVANQGSGNGEASVATA